MGEVWQQGNRFYSKQLFNEQQALAIFNETKKSGTYFNSIQFQNVGIKIMRQALKVFQELNIQQVIINYDWNQIMMKPQLVCYDKNKWKTLQQLSNWNKQWNQLFSQCFSLKFVHLNIKISWMDDQWVKQVLQGLVRLPNVSTVTFKASSKDQKVCSMLEAFKKANVFAQFQFEYENL